MKILLLGGTYFIGRHLARHLVSCGHDVTLLNRGTRASSHPTLVVDRNDPRTMRSILANLTFDAVIDTSCYDATQALIAEGALAGRYGQWMFLSSAAVYGDQAARPLHEGSATTGSLSFGSYGRRKLEAERVLTESCGARLTILRPAYVYGPGNNLARETFIWARLLCGEDIYLPGEGDTHVSFIHVQDLARAVHDLLLATPSGARAFNLAHHEKVSFRDWVLCLAKQAGVEARLHPVPTQEVRIDARQFFPFRDLELSLDVSHLQTEAGFYPMFDLDAGLADTYNSYEREGLARMLRSSSVEIELDAALSREDAPLTATGEHRAVSTSPPKA